ncbi:hypothetical protein D0962_23315 [Leptolyngbyaceae cyanobacterium CCMR0082]|uniref:Uncharacterized protein n=1 Tax=Adonisia turfae CCMR0082 TaxID=2304604 RepID=A0A6M0SAX1_9CYAN|nr:hypothetical protein [Adonisia turfae CCMR0082]
MSEYYIKIHLVVDAVIGLAVFTWLAAFVVDKSVSRVSRLILGRDGYYRLLKESCKKLFKERDL